VRKCLNGAHIGALELAKFKANKRLSVVIATNN